MARLISLDHSFLPYFRQLLRDGLALGPLIEDTVDLTQGSLDIWAPEGVETVAAADLHTDIFYGKEHSPKTDITAFVTSAILEEETNLLVGETDRLVTEEPPAKNAARFPWLVIPSSIETKNKYLCVCLSTRRVDEQRWSAFERELKPYPSIVVIANRPHDLVLAPGEFRELRKDQLKVILQNTRYILVGIFDEVSRIRWTRKLIQNNNHVLAVDSAASD